MKRRHSFVAAALVMGLGAGSLNAQSPQADSGSRSLGAVSIEHPVLANRQPLAPSLYDVHLTNEWPDPLEPGEQQGMQWVEFRAKGRTAGRETALVIPAAAINAISEWHPVLGSTRVVNTTPAIGSAVMTPLSPYIARLFPDIARFIRRASSACPQVSLRDSRLARALNS